MYETALKKNPRDGALASKIGQALVKTHHYGKVSHHFFVNTSTSSLNTHKAVSYTHLTLPTIYSV